MKFLSDENGQGVAEYLLLFAGVIVAAVAVLVVYGSYFTSQPFDSAADVQAARTHTATNTRL